MTTETISVPEIHCGHCKSSIEGALAPIEGVTRAEVSVEDRTVTVAYDENVVDRARLVSEIADQGYEVTA